MRCSPCAWCTAKLREAFSAGASAPRKFMSDHVVESISFYFFTPQRTTSCPLTDCQRTSVSKHLQSSQKATWCFTIQSIHMTLLQSCRTASSTWARPSPEESSLVRTRTAPRLPPCNGLLDVSRSSESGAPDTTPGRWLSETRGEEKMSGVTFSNFACLSCLQVFSPLPVYSR